MLRSPAPPSPREARGVSGWGPHEVPSRRSGLSALLLLEGRPERRLGAEQEAWPRFHPQKRAPVAALSLPSSLTGGVRGGRDQMAWFCLKKKKRLKCVRTAGIGAAPGAGRVLGTHRPDLPPRALAQQEKEAPDGLWACGVRVAQGTQSSLPLSLPPSAPLAPPLGSPSCTCFSESLMTSPGSQGLPAGPTLPLTFPLCRLLLPLLLGRAGVCWVPTPGPHPLCFWGEGGTRTEGSPRPITVAPGPLRGWRSWPLQYPSPPPPLPPCVALTTRFSGKNTEARRGT